MMSRRRASIDFSKPSQAVFTLADGNVITVTGTAADDKRWVEVKSAKDAALNTKTQNRAFEVASYRFDAIFRPLEQLLVPKESKPTGPPAAKPLAPRAAAPRGAARGAAAPGAAAPGASPEPTP